MKPYRSARRCSRHESFLFRMNVYVVRTWKNTPLCVYVKWKFTRSKMTMELVWVWIHYKCTKQNKCNNRLKSEAKIFDFLSHSIFGDFWLRMGNQTSTHGEYVGLAHAHFFDQHTLYFSIHPIQWFNFIAIVTHCPIWNHYWFSIFTLILSVITLLFANKKTKERYRCVSVNSAKAQSRLNIIIDWNRRQIFCRWHKSQCP